MMSRLNQMEMIDTDDYDVEEWGRRNAGRAEWGGEGMIRG